jgi:hypothetical protein
MTLMADEPRTSARRSAQALLAWHGWRLNVPPRWNPVKVEGDYQTGYMLLADLHRPRLGIRWRSAAGKVDVQRWAHDALRGEVGLLAASEARDHPLPGDLWEGSRLYVEPEPPGRDVWVARSCVSGRLVQVIHHAHRRERVLAEQVLPSLTDQPVNEPGQWSIFDLSCRVPPGWALSNYRLNAGDLTLRFQHRVKRFGLLHLLTVRQIAPATLALHRRPLLEWLRVQQYQQRRLYRVLLEAFEDTLPTPDGRTLAGQRGVSIRRKRYFWLTTAPRQMTTLALHDPARDRLVLVQSTDEATARHVGATIGAETQMHRTEDA